ncbi:MAG: T9SS type A sorting domain-containing protein [Flavobacterium sp.]|nr:T9SS type A sorting domain-containing protein [Flavobacterium sp.]
MRNKIFTLIVILQVVAVYSQPLIVDSSITPTEIVQNTLVGSGITPTNIKFNKSLSNALITRDQIGVFTNGQGTNLGLASGVVLSTGQVQYAGGPNNQNGASHPTLIPIANDVDLALLSSNLIQNIATVEFDFVSTGTEIGLDFIYASEDYPEYATSSFSDVMGIFLSGPDIAGPYSNNAKNIALLPSTSIPISTNSVNNGTMNNGPCINCNFYVNNGTGTTPIANATIQFDGFTTEINTTATVQIGSIYHLKIAIGNVSDNLYDSAIFIKANSFKTATLSNPNFEISKMTISPNPASNEIQLSLKDSSDSIEEITLVSLLGQQNDLSIKSVGNEILVDVSSLSKGLYFVEVKTKNNLKYFQKLAIN